jgi:hypothetical protein
LWKSPPLFAVTIFLGGFGSIQLTRVLFEGGWYLMRWKSFAFGDSLCLPLFALGEAYLLKYYTPNPQQNWYDRKTVPVIICFAAWILAILFDAWGIARGIRPLSSQTVPSQIVHLFISGLLASALLTPIIPVLKSSTSWQTKIAVFLPAACYLLLVLYDNSPLQDQSPSIPPYHW